MNLKKTLATIIFGSSLALSSFFPMKAHSDDVSATRDVSTTSTLDLDGDGLTNTSETLIGTNPNNRDTDGDGFGDGIEYFAPGYADPLSSSVPEYGGVQHTLYDIVSIQDLTSGNTNDVLSPVWTIRGRVNYIESDSNFANGVLYSKNIHDLSEGRLQLENSGLDAEIREIGASPLGIYIYYHKDNAGKDEIYKVNRLNGNVTRAVPGAGRSLEYSVRNPTLFSRLRINSETNQLEENGTRWLLAETDNPTSTTGQIYGFKLNTSGLAIGNWDGSTPVQVTNLSLGATHTKVARPKVSRDGDKLLFQLISPSDGTNYLGVCNGLENILNGITQPYDISNVNELRTDITVSIPLGGVSFPGGFGGKGNFIYFTNDWNNSYRLNDPLNFSGADFDLMVTPVGVNSSGRFGVTNPGKVRIPLPGNQIAPAVSPEGMRVAFADDYLSNGVPGGNFNLYATRVAPLIKVTGSTSADLFNNLTLPNGTVFADNRPTDVIDISNAQPYESLPTHILSVLSPLKPISDATQSGFSITNIKRFGPPGLQMNPTSSNAYLQVRESYHVADLALDDGSVIDESTLTPSVYNTSTGLYESIPTEDIVERNLTQKFIKYKIHHFSNYGLKGNILPKVNPVDSKVWNLYE